MEKTVVQYATVASFAADVTFSQRRIPNGLGVLFAVGQVILYVIYYKSTQQIIEARKRKADQVAMTEVVVDGKNGSTANAATGNGHY